jgi:hypothetical protein
VTLFQKIHAWCVRELHGPSRKKEPCPPVQNFFAKLGTETSSPHPAICFGHQAESFAREVSDHSSLNTMVPEDLEGLAHVCTCEAFANIGLHFAALIARSRPDHNGEAGEAIRVFQEKQRRRAASFYGAWDYDVARAASRAIEYGADGIVMPGTDANELYAYLFGVMKLVEEGAAVPATAQEHIDRLKEFAPSSPFWTSQDAVESANF